MVEQYIAEAVRPDPMSPPIGVYVESSTPFPPEEIGRLRHADIKSGELPNGAKYCTFIVDGAGNDHLLNELHPGVRGNKKFHESEAVVKNFLARHNGYDEESDSGLSAEWNNSSWTIYGEPETIESLISAHTEGLLVDPRHAGGNGFALLSKERARNYLPQQEFRRIQGISGRIADYLFGLSILKPDSSRP